MKKKSIFISVLSLMLFFTTAIVYAGAVDIGITTPSTNQSRIAPNRDFYVIGSLNGTISKDSTLSIELYREGRKDPVRIVETTGKDSKQSLNINYPLLSYYSSSDRTPLYNSMMPDLVYDMKDPKSFAYAWNKAYFTDKTFTALIAGGEYSKDLILNDKSGKPLEKLQPGNYTIVVSVKDSTGKVLGTATKKLTIAHAANRILSRFSPEEHFSNIKQFAKANGYETFLDPFPGYWSPSGYIPELSGSSIFAEILPKWRLADAQEYQSGLAHFVIYNVSDTSATYNVEIGTLQHQKVIEDSKRLKSYYYSYGEPTLSNGMKSKIEEFKDGDKLQITRVDKLGQFSATLPKDNYLDDNEISKIKSYDVDMKDGVAAKSREVLAFNGVVTPIQNSSKDIVKSSDGTYKIGNKITSVEYAIVDNNTGHVYLKQNKKVGLDRMIGNRVRNSLFEFRHILQIPSEIIGKNVSVRISAKDSYGNTIAGTQENINLTVAHSK